MKVCKETKTITQEFEEIRQQMCDKYCRFPELSLQTNEDPDKAFEWLMHSYCENCPLKRL